MHSDHYRCLALDIGRSTGWALLDDDRVVDSGTEVFPYNSDDGHSGEGRRFVKFYNWLHDMITNYHVEEVVYERVTGFQKSMAAAGLYYGFEAFLKSATQNLRLVPIQTGQLKREFTGHGAAKKEAMCARAIELGWTNGVLHTDQNNDEADAIALLFVHMERRKRYITIATREEREQWLNRLSNNGTCPTSAPVSETPETL